jgi:hypothetical protein
MKYLHPFTYLMFFGALLVFSSCEESDQAQTNVQANLEVQLAEDIPADPNVTRGPDGSTPPPSFTFFSLTDGEIIDKADSASRRWDIALAGTTILVNGGTSGPGQGAAQIVNGTFDDLSEAPETGYATDQGSELAIPTGSGNGWYTYTGEGNPPQAILTIPGRIIVLQTADGNYAKMEILSYYEGNPDTSAPEFSSFQTRPAGRHYTFQYVVQPNGSRNF